MNSIHLSEAQRDLLDRSRARASRQARVFAQQATPERADELAQFSQLYPNNSSTMGLGLSISGVPVTDPIVAQISQIELENRATNGPVEVAGGGIWDTLSRGVGEFVLDPVKGSVRWGMMGLMSVYESTVGGTVPRAIRQANQTPGRELTGERSTLYEHQPFLTRALADVFRDPGATLASVWEEATTADAEQEERLRAGTQRQYGNVGSGFFPGSTVDPEVQTQVMERSAEFDQTLTGLPPSEQYSARLEQSPQIWRDAVAGSQYQQNLGIPITNQGYADREGVMFDIPSVNPAAVNGRFRVPWSPGRIVTAQTFEPGTEAFSRVSGIGDFSAQLFLDPTNLLGAYWAKTGKLGRTIGVVQRKIGKVASKILDTSRVDDVTQFRGLVGGERNPIRAFGGEVLDDTVIAKIRSANEILTPEQAAMLDEGIWFSDPNAYLAWKGTKAIVEAGGVAFDDIDQLRVIEGLSDESVSLLDDMRLQVGDDIVRGGPTDVPEAQWEMTYGAITTLGRNLIETRLPLGERGLLPGTVFHGGAEFKAGTEGLELGGGISHFLERSFDYAGLQDAAGGRGVVHLFEEAGLDPALQRGLRPFGIKTDIETYKKLPPKTPKQEALFAEARKILYPFYDRIDELSAEAAAIMKKGRTTATPVRRAKGEAGGFKISEADNARFDQITKEIESVKKQIQDYRTSEWKNWTAEDRALFGIHEVYDKPKLASTHLGTGYVVAKGAPVPYATYSTDEVRKFLDEGAIPFKSTDFEPIPGTKGEFSLSESGIQTLGRNAIESRIPITPGVRRSIQDVSEEAAIAPGVVAHGGVRELAEEGVTHGGVTSDLGRAAGYAEKKALFESGEPGMVRLFWEEAVTPELREALKFGDVERYIAHKVDVDDLELFKQLDEDLIDEITELRQTFDDYTGYLDDVESGLYDAVDVAKVDADELALLERTKVARKLLDEKAADNIGAEKIADYRDYVHKRYIEFRNEPSTVVGHQGLVPFASYTPEEVRSFIKEGGIPYRPSDWEPITKGPNAGKVRFEPKDVKAFKEGFDDFYLIDGSLDDFNTLDAASRSVPKTHRSVSQKKPQGGNAKVRVFGQTLDATEDLSKLDPSLLAELRRAGLWSPSLGWTGFADEAISEIPASVFRSLAERGYGKIKMGDDEWLILDDFIGGSRVDPSKRVFFENGDLPLSANPGFASAVGTTPNQVNAYIDWLQNVGRHGLDDLGNIDPSKLTREALDEFRKTNASQIDATKQAVDDAGGFGATIDGNRPSVDMSSHMLGGKRARLFIRDLAKMSRADDASIEIDRALRYFDRNRIAVPRATRQKLIEAGGSEAKVEAVLLDWISETGPLTLQGGTRYGRTRLLPGLRGRTPGQGGVVTNFLEQPQIARRFALMIPNKAINLVDDPDGAYPVLAALTQNYNVRRGSAPIAYVTKDGFERTTRAIEDVLGDIRRLEPGQKLEAYRLMGEFTEVLFAQASKSVHSKNLGFLPAAKVPTQLVSEITGVFDDVGRMHTYNTERMGMTELGEGLGDMLRIGGDPTYVPGMNFTVEAWSGAFHFSNARTVKRVMNYSDTLGTVANLLVAKKVYKSDTVGEWGKLRRVAKKELAESQKVARKKLNTANSIVARAEARVGRAKTPEALADATTRLAVAQKRADEINPLLGSLKEAKDHIRNNAADYNLVDRMGTMVARSAIQKLWKPLVLLRGAWMVKILIDDQMRIGAEGYDTIFNHPFRFVNYALSQPDSFKNAFKTGFIDLHGVRVSLKDIDEVQFGKFFQDAMMATSDGIFGRGAYGSKFAAKALKGRKNYDEGLTNRVSQLSSDPLNSLLSSSKADNPAEEVVQWLLGRRPDLEPLGRSGAKYREELIQYKGGNPELAQAIADGNEDVIRRLVRQYEAELHQTTGGVVLLDDGIGNWRKYGEKETVVTQIDGQTIQPPTRRVDSNEFIPVVHIRGDSEILAIVADGRGPMLSPLRKGAKQGHTLSNVGHAELKKLIGLKVDDSIPGRFPGHVYSPDLARGGYPDSIGETYNRALRAMFDFFMSKPSNALSRSPVFEQAYWRHIGQGLDSPMYGPKARAAIVAKAEDAGQLGAVKRSSKRTREWYDQQPGPRNPTPLIEPQNGREMKEFLDALDEQAKAMGLAQVQRTLFDLTTRRNFSDSMTLIFPFVEAYGEFISRWGRLAVYGDRNIKNANRFQQTVNGLRESDPFDPTGDQGFFHENQFGEEVFSYPSIGTKAGIVANNALASLPFVGGPLFGEQVDPSIAENIKVTAPVSSLNFASTVIPGFGPVAQIGSQVILNDDPKWDPIKEIISPFGETSSLVSFLPSWAKKMLAAQQHSDPALNALYLSTVQDVIKTMQLDGEFDNIHTEEDYRNRVTTAEERATSLLMVRAAATFIVPAAPQYTFQTEDRTGKVWAYNELGQAYREILYDEMGGDQGEAFQTFHERYGFLPTPFTQGRTYAVKERSITTEGSIFERLNESLFNKYDTTARFLQPGIGGEDEEFSWARHLVAIKGDEREYRTPEQWVSISDDLLGDIWWDNALKGLDHYRQSGDIDTYEGLKAQVDDQIRTIHPYWRQRAAPGQVTGVDPKKQVAEVHKWLDDPVLEGAPVVEAARKYLAARAKFISMMAEENMTLSGSYSTDDWKNAVAIRVRAELRTLASDLSEVTGEFDVLWRNVFANEVSQRHDGWEPDTVDFYGEDLFEVAMGFSPNEEPKFTGNLGGFAKKRPRAKIVGA